MHQWPAEREVFITDAATQPASVGNACHSCLLYVASLDLVSVTNVQRNHNDYSG